MEEKEKRKGGEEDGEKEEREEEEEKKKKKGMRKSWLGGAILGDNPGFGDNFNLKGGSVRGTTRIPDIFFLDFLLFFFYIIFFYCLAYILY